ncbi:MAG: diphthamide biosynthesis enzyme Dph2, partial [Candidatus Micrarchaeota archaeon]
MPENYDFETPRVIEELKKLGAKSALLQFPEGLKQQAPVVMDELKKQGIEPVLSADPCYGACDFKSMKECGATVHYGHAPLRGMKAKNAIFVECGSGIDIIPALESAMPLLIEYKNKKQKIGLITTSQHIKKLEGVKPFLKQRGITAVIGKKGPRAEHNGQVLGCDAGSAESIAGEVGAFLFIGSGRFHPLFAAYKTGKPVIIANPYSNSVDMATAHEWKKESLLRIESAGAAKTFGAVVSTKPGQKNWERAEELAKKGGAYLIAVENITPEVLDYLPFDAY